MRKNNNRTTVRHFETFKKEVKLWIDRFNLGDWRVFISHARDSPDTLATTTSDIPGRVSTINLNTSWAEEKISVFQLRKTALHEVLELLFARLGYLGECRFLGDEEIPEEKHVIIRKLENYFYGNDNFPTIKKV